MTAEGLALAVAENPVRVAGFFDGQSSGIHHVRMWCWGGIAGEGFPGTAVNTSMYAAPPPSMAPELPGKPSPAIPPSMISV